MAKIDHAAIRTSSYEDAQKFFDDVFDMHMWREIGEKPERKCWFREGIQLCEVSAINTDAENGYETIEGNKVYSLYFIIQCKSDEDEYYKKYRVLFDRNGINDVSELN